jgi:hypothetical protein
MKEEYPNSVDTIEQYVFNHSLMKEFSGIEYSPFRVPCIFGYVFISSPQFKAGTKTDFYLVSRKDCCRPGRRFITRGIDLDGNVANFVETEHIFVHYLINQSMKIAAFTQIRGSIPLLWSMKPSLKWSPPVKINSDFDNSVLAADIHFRKTKKLYGSQYLVNLIDKKGSQDRIGKAFTRLHSELKDD